MRFQPNNDHGPRSRSGAEADLLGETTGASVFVQGSRHESALVIRLSDATYVISGFTTRNAARNSGHGLLRWIEAEQAAGAIAQYVHRWSQQDRHIRIWRVLDPGSSTGD